MSGITSVYDCGPKGCHFLINEKPPDPALLHKALQAAKEIRSREAVRIDDIASSDSQSSATLESTQSDKEDVTSSSLRGATSSSITNHLNDCQEGYHPCGRDRIYVCHYNGLQFTTMCVRQRSPLFRNLHPSDSCGACLGSDTPTTSGGPRGAKIQKKPTVRGRAIPLPLAVDVSDADEVQGVQDWN